MKNATDISSDRARRSLLRSVLIIAAIWSLDIAQAGAQSDAQKSAQDRTEVGLTAVYEFGLDPAASRNAGFGDWCDCPGNGEMLGHASWIAITAAHHSILGKGLGLSSSLRFGSASAVFVGRQSVPGSLGDTLKEYQEDSRSSLLQVDLAASTYVGNESLISVGGWVSLPVSYSSNRFWRPLRVADVAAAGKAEPLDASTAGESYRLAWGTIVKGMVRVPLSPHVTLYPELYTRIDAGRLFAGETLGAFMVGGGTSFLFDPTELFRPSPPPVQFSTPLPLPEPPPARISPPTASIAIYAVDRNGVAGERALIRPRRERHLRQIPLTTTFRFLPASEEFAEPYRIDHRSASDDISIDSLAWLGADEVALQGLNIIGSRLKATPGARIKLVAVTMVEEPIALGVARAARIRRYLHERWGIEEQRIVVRTIVSRNPDVTDPMVLVTCSGTTLSTPVEAEWIEESFDAPRIALRPDMQAAAGVRHWRVDVHCGDRIVSSCSSDSTSGASPTIAFDLRGIDPGARLSPLIARLVVEDSSGAIVTATDDLGVALEQRADSGTIGEQVRYILPSGTISHAGQRSGCARRIARIVRDGAHITLTPYGPPGVGGRPSRQQLELFAEQIRRQAGRPDLTITIDENNAGHGRNRPDFDIEVAVLQQAPGEG